MTVDVDAASRWDPEKMTDRRVRDLATQTVRLLADEAGARRLRARLGMSSRRNFGGESSATAHRTRFPIITHSRAGWARADRET